MRKVIATFIFAFMLVGCSNQKMLRPDTTITTTYLMKFQIDKQNYSMFQSLFSEGAENTISKDEFNQFGEISTSGARFQNFELLTFDNGEMLLVEFQPKFENEDEYKIVNVQIVPDEMKVLFEKK